MKGIFKVICFLAITHLLLGCSKEYEIPQELIVHDFVWKGLNAYYLYQDDVSDLSDRRFNSDQELHSYLASFADYNELFSSLILPSDLKSGLVEDYASITTSESRTGFTNGMEFGIIADPNSDENVIGYVSHILPNSDAAHKNIERGEFFSAVNGMQLTKDNFQDALLNGSDSFTLQMVSFDGSVVSPIAKTVILEREIYTYPLLFLEKTISTPADNIGYVCYFNDFSETYINGLNNVFLKFKNETVSKLVLDFRYGVGSGSFAKNMSILASMITSQFKDEVLIKEAWNTKAQSWFLANQPEFLSTNFTNQLNETTAIHSPDITDLYIILNGQNFRGSSAVELLINSLSPYINVHIVGNQTIGNSTGSITLYDAVDYDFGLKNNTHTVALQPVVLNFLNADNQSYTNGFSPTIDLCANEDALNLGVLGESSDPILSSIIDFISSGNTGAFNSCNPNNLDYLFHSIDLQRNLDSGVFIERDLPNTY